MDGPDAFDDLRRALVAALGAEVRSMTPVHGGDNASAFDVRIERGGADGPRRVFVKAHRAAPAEGRAAPPMDHRTEALGLEWLAAADALDVPEVLAVDVATDERPGFLVLEWIEVGSPVAHTESDLGAGMAALHRAGAPCFGRDDRRPTGSRHLPNEPCDSWVEFYATQRLLPLARLAHDEGALPSDAIEGLESIAARLDLIGGPVEPPARLHGDLWAGNRIVDRGGRSWLVDPAAHGGHREFDLAMMRLFGGFAEESFRSYRERSPLADGWRERIPLHQLAPLAVHAIKFGGGYVRACSEAIDACR